METSRRVIATCAHAAAGHVLALRAPRHGMLLGDDPPCHLKCCLKCLFADARLNKLKDACWKFVGWEY